MPLGTKSWEQNSFAQNDKSELADLQQKEAKLC